MLRRKANPFQQFTSTNAPPSLAHQFIFELMTNLNKKNSQETVESVRHHINYHCYSIKPPHDHELLSIVCEFHGPEMFHFFADEMKLPLHTKNSFNLLFFATLNLNFQELNRVFYQEKFLKRLHDGTTIAHVAAACGDISVLEKNEKLVFATDRAGRTPAFYAGLRNHQKVFTFLLTHKDLTNALQIKIIKEFFEGRAEQKKQENGIATNSHNSLAILTRKAEKYGYSDAVNITGKHSLYFAIAYLTQFNPNGPAEESTLSINDLRELCASHLSRNAAHYKPSFSGDFTAYTANIKKDAPGDVWAITAIAQELKCTIVVVNLDEEAPITIYKHQNPSITLVIGHDCMTNQYFAFTRNPKVVPIECLAVPVLSAEPLPPVQYPLNASQEVSFATHFGKFADSRNSSTSSCTYADNSECDDNNDDDDNDKMPDRRLTKSS